MKRVLITGGNGDIAKAIGHRLANEGFEVYTPNSLQLDVTDSYGIKLMMELVKPDILINCAGYIKPQALVDLTVEELYNHIDINLIGSIMCAKYAVQNGATHVINIGSSAGVNPKGGWLAYCVSKSALTMFQKCLEEEGIECLTLHIGRTDTKMRSKLFPNETKEFLMSPEDVADAIFCAIRDGKDGVWQLRKRTRDWELIE